MEINNSTEENKEVSGSGAQHSKEPLIAGRYRKLSLINSGNRSAVWLVADTQAGDKHMALKLLSTGLTYNPRSYNLFRDTMRRAKQLTHPGFVQIIDTSDQDDHQHYFTMEYVEGQRLDTLLGEGTGGLKFPELVSTTLELFEAAKFAYSLGIILTPLNPKSIFITEAGAKIYHRAEDQNLLTVSAVCTVMDRPTVYYHSPNTLGGEFDDERSMIYNLGLLAYEMATGVPLFQSRDLEELIKMHLYKPAPKISLLRSDIPEWYQSFVSKCLRKSRFWRYHSLARAIKCINAHRQGL